MVNVLVSVWSLIFVVVCAKEDSPEVTISQGVLRGSYRKTWKGRPIRAFTGIPYAKPPIGDLRFKVAVPAEPWNGTLDASKPHAICPQGIFQMIGDEDCLFLNVYTPQLTGPNKQHLPVMVYIHGGGFSIGSANPDLSGPDILLDQDIILVTINYRLGALGFLSTEDEVMPGNNGLKDQNLALKWVKNNIAHFDGDPQRITIFGQSAGGASVHCHVLSPASKDLIFAAIAQSGSVTTPLALAPKGQAVRNAKRLGELLNCPTNSSRQMINCLRDVKARDIVAQIGKFYEWNFDQSAPFKPVIEPDLEGAFLAEDPVDIIKSKNFAHVPFMMGITKEDGAVEAAMIYNDSKLVIELNNDFNRIAPLIFQYDEKVPNKDNISQQIRKFYFGNRTIDNSTKSEVTDMMTDGWFMAPQNFAAEWHANYSKRPVYYYLFGYRGSVTYARFYGDTTYDYGAAHGDELIYLLSGNLFGNYKPNAAEERLNHIMTTLWANFARTGNPTPEEDALIPTKWEPVESENLKYYFIKSYSNISMIANPYVERSTFWNNLGINPFTRREGAC